MPKSILAALPNALIRAASSLGYDAAALARAAGLEATELADPDARVPVARHLALWQALCERDGNPGMDLGERLGTAALGVVGHALVHAETVGDAMACVSRFRRLVLDDAVPTLSFEDGKRLAALTQTLPKNFAALRHPAECQLVATTTLLRRLTGEPFSPEEVRFPHPPPVDTRQHATFFRAKLVWSGPNAALVFDASLLGKPLARTDPALFAYLARRADALLTAVGDETLTETTRRRVVETLPSGAPQAPFLAAKLGMSVRTFHRRLAAEGAKLSDLIDEVRLERARTMLADRSNGVGQVAYALGYTEHAAFTRAFKRWTGESPEAYRRRMEHNFGRGSSL